MLNKCPYANCAKKIDKMIMLVDNRRIPRETYYVCPHCKKRIDLTLKEGSLKFSCHSRNTRRENKSSQSRSEKEVLIKALHNFAAELEGQRGKKLTDEEATASIKIVKGVISSLQAERFS